MKDVEIGCLFFIATIAFFWPVIETFIKENEKEKEEKAKKLFEERSHHLYNCIEKHFDTLWIKKKQTIYKDDYGREIVDGWLKEIDYFIRNIVFPEIEDENVIVTAKKQMIDFFFRFEYELIMEGAEETSKINIPVQTGVDYELYVENTFVESGYTVTRTPATGDQGVDLILEKDGVRTAVQCKYYSKPVGNKAVQEVIAGKGFYQCEKAMVVSNAPFTKSARQLAENSGVELINIEC